MASNVTSAPVAATVSVALVSDEPALANEAVPSPIVAGNAPPDDGPIENQYFYEDEVFKFDTNGRVKFGVVMKTYEEAASDTERSDHEDNLKKREIRVAWHPSGTVEVTQEQYIGLADRTLMPGDVVRRIIPGKDTQKGYCREVFVSADVNIKGTSYIAKNVTSTRMRPLSSMFRDNAVCMDSWVGSTKTIDEKLTLKTACGSIVELRPDHEYSTLKDADTKYRRGFFAGTLYYPGQTLVWPANSPDRDSAKWLHITPELRTSKKATTFTVQSVETEGVYVHWQCRALSDSVDAEIRESQPQSYVTGDDLKRLRRLNLFEACMLQINDKNYLTIEENDILNLVRKSQWRKERGIFFDSKKTLFNQLKQRTADEKERAAAANSDTNSSEDRRMLSATLPTPHHHEKPVPKFVEANCDGKKLSAAKVKLGMINAKLVPPASSDGGFEPDAKKHIETTIAKMFRHFDHQNSRNVSDSDGWNTDEDDVDEDGEAENSCSGDSVTTGSSCCSSPTPRNSPKRSPLFNKKMIKFQKRSERKRQDRPPKVGETAVTETAVVYSNATVVWQDGSIETGISSRQLYPIHHLDAHEFFPGDFVLTGVESDDVSYRDYGVIQRVDHIGRTAIVKWFSTYTSPGSPTPTFYNESEVSVYDLLDHPDFQYRPGTIVIRVANFKGDDALCTAGQVVDNYAEGRVRVWWVDGHDSMCWPQDLFEVGQYDADHNFWLSNESDNDSWETESLRSEPGSPLELGGMKPLPKLTANLERARGAMAQLEEMFAHNANLENQEVMRKLLEVYKKCRYMDRLMNTSFFHEEKFQGLIERVRRVSTTTTTVGRVLDHKNRLFNDAQPLPPSQKQQLSNTIVVTSTPGRGIASSMISQQDTSKLPQKCIHPELAEPEVGSDDDDVHKHSDASATTTSTKLVVDVNFADESSSSDFDVTATPPPPPASSEASFSNYPNKLFGFVMHNIDNASKETDDLCRLSTNHHDASSKCQANHANGSKSNSNSADSGNHSKTEWGEMSSASEVTNEMNDSLGGLAAVKPKNNEEDHTSNSCCSIDMAGSGGGVNGDSENMPKCGCARLCALIKVQLVMALKEINERFSQSNNSFSEVIVVDESTVSMVTDEVPVPVPMTKEMLDNCLDTDELLMPDSTSAEEVDSSSCVSLTPIISAPMPPSDCCIVLDSAPQSHTYHLTLFQPLNAQQFFRAVRFDYNLLQTALPPGVWVRAYEDRVDLLSVMIEGPKNTPYEDGMFLFDIQLGKEYPRAPPLCHYISYCSDRLNPNLYEDGKVCVSLLGTWSGRGSEIWGPSSTLLQVIVSIQGLILVTEPYFNEAGYEKQKGTQQGIENSRMYNEMVILKMLQSMSKMMSNPSEVFREQIVRHFCECGDAMHDRIKGWMDASIRLNETATALRTDVAIVAPEFSLLPASRGFCLTLVGLLHNFREKVEKLRRLNGTAFPTT